MRKFNTSGWTPKERYENNARTQGINSYGYERQSFDTGGRVKTREHHMDGGNAGNKKRKILNPPLSPKYDSDTSVILDVPPMTQSPHGNACWAATSGMAHNYHVKQGKLGSSKKLKNVNEVAQKANAGYQARLRQSSSPYDLRNSTDVSNVLTDIGLEPESFASGVNLPPLKGKESLKEKLSDRTPVIIAASTNRAASQQDPFVDPDAHYITVSGVHPRRNSITINDPAYKGGARQEVQLSPGGTSFKSGPTKYYPAVPTLAYPPNTAYGSSPVSSQSSIKTKSGRVISKPVKYKA